MFNINNLVYKENNIASSIVSFSEQNNMSYLTEALDISMKIKSEYISINKELYSMSLNESADIEVINESFKTFINKSIIMIEKIIQYIKSLIDRFIVEFFRLIKSDNYIIKNKNEFNKFSKSHEFDINGYDYTINGDIPLILAQMEFREDFYDIDDPKAIKLVYKSFIDKIRDRYYDEFRATVIGRDGEYIIANDFMSELFKTYRSNMESESEINVTSNVVDESLYNLINYKLLEKSISRLKTDIETQYNKIKNDIISSTKMNYTKDGVELIYKDIDNGINTTIIDKEYIRYFDLFIKAKVDQIEKMSNIHTLSIGSKLDAIKDRHIQDRKILYTALKKVKGGK